MTSTGLNHWLRPFSGSIRELRRGRRPRLAFRPGGEALERRIALATATWIGAGADANWLTPGNWLHGYVPTSGDALVFLPSASVHETAPYNNLSASTSFTSITFQGGAYTVSGNAIKLAAGGQLSDTAAGSIRFNLQIVMGSGLMTINAAANATVNLGGAISGGQPGPGDTSVLKSGKGALVISGSSPNTYSGAFVVSEGSAQLSKTAGVTAIPGAVTVRAQRGSTATLTMLSNEQFGQNSNVSLEANSALDLNGTTQTIPVLSVYGQVTGTDKAQLILLNGLSGTGTINVALSLSRVDHDVFVRSGTTLTINGPINGEDGAALILSGGGTLMFAGTRSNTYAGSIFVNEGTLLLSKSGSKPDDQVTAVVGTLLIGTTGQPGVVRLGANNQFSGDNMVFMGASGLFDLNGFSTFVPGLEMDGGTVSNGTLVLGADGVLASPAPSSPGQPAVISAALQLGATTRTFDVSGNPGNVGLKITGAIVGTGDVGLTKNGAGTLLLAGSSANTYKGATTVNDGRVQLNKSGADNRAISGPLTIGQASPNSPAAVVQLLANHQIQDSSSVTVNPTGQFDLNGRNEYIGALTLMGGAVNTGTGVLSLNGNVTATSVKSNTPAQITGNLSLGPDGRYTRVFTISQGPAPEDLIINGVISGELNARLTKTGAGTLMFASSTSNTYTGLTTVSQGVLELNKSKGQAIGANLVIDGEVGKNPGKVVLLSPEQFLDTSNVTVKALGQLDVNGNDSDIHDLTVTGGLVTIGGNGFGVLGTLSMTGGQINTGSGILAALNRVKATALNGVPAMITGTLVLSPNTTTFAVSKSTATDLVVDGVVSFSYTLDKTGNGVMALTGSSPEWLRVIDVRSGVLRIAGGYGEAQVRVYGGVFEGSGTIKSLATDAKGTMQVAIGTPTTMGVLNATGGVNLAPAATLQVKLNGGANPAPGVSFDQLTSAGRIDLNGAKLTLDVTGFQIPPVGTRYRIINNTSTAPLVGTFANLPNGSRLEVPIPDTNKRILFAIEYGAGPDDNDVELEYRGEIVPGSTEL